MAGLGEGTALTGLFLSASAWVSRVLLWSTAALPTVRPAIDAAAAGGASGACAAAAAAEEGTETSETAAAYSFAKASCMMIAYDVVIFTCHQIYPRLEARHDWRGMQQHLRALHARLAVQ